MRARCRPFFIILSSFSLSVPPSCPFAACGHQQQRRHLFFCKLRFSSLFSLTRSRAFWNTSSADFAFFLPSFLHFSIALQFWFHLNLFFCFFLPPPCFLQNNSSIGVTHWNSDVLEIGKRLCEDAEEKEEEEGKDRQTEAKC